MDTWTSPRRPSESPRGAASAEVRHPPRLGRLPFPPGLCVGRSHTRRLPRAKCHHHCKPSSHPMARLKGFAGDFYVLELRHGEPDRAEIRAAVMRDVRRTQNRDGWGGVWRARSCAPRTRGGVHFGFAIGWPREALVTCSLCGAGAAHVWMWAKRGLKIVLPAALWLLFCGSGGDRDMYVHARRCMFAVALWDRRDVVARGRNSHAACAVCRVRVYSLAL